MLEDAHSMSEGLWRMAQLAQDAAEALDARIEDENLDVRLEAMEVPQVLKRLRTLSIEVGEELDAYQKRHTRLAKHRCD
jgi:hypothetical protein